jgi:hypothetical protein
MIKTQHCPNCEAQAAEIERLRVEAKAQFDRGYYDGCANPIVRHDALPPIGSEGRYSHEGLSSRCAVIAHVEGWLEVSFFGDGSTAVIRPSRFKETT